jgi:phosphopantetheinyl transferase
MRLPHTEHDLMISASLLQASARAEFAPQAVPLRLVAGGPAIAGVVPELWIATEAADPWLEARADVLASSERLELVRIRSETQRWRALSARILLREALTQACDCRVPASAWRFVAPPNGKPEIAEELPQLHFSVSHVDALAVVAVSRDRPLGVDAEMLDQPVSEDVIAGFLSANERRLISDSDRTLRVKQFLRLWTLKEAYTKLIGEGLGTDFATIEFAIDTPTLRTSAHRHADARFETFEFPCRAGKCQISLAIGTARIKPIGRSQRLKQ